MYMAVWLNCHSLSLTVVVSFICIFILFLFLFCTNMHVYTTHTHTHTYIYIHIHTYTYTYTYPQKRTPLLIDRSESQVVRTFYTYKALLEDVSCLTVPFGKSGVKASDVMVGHICMYMYIYVHSYL